MAIFARNSGGGDFENPEPGSYVARCYKMVDVGTQEVTYQGKPSQPKRQLLVWFELLEDEDGQPYRMENGEPFMVMNRYTLSTSPKANLRKHIDAWRGKPLTKAEAEEFDVTVLLDKYCRLQVSVDDSGERTYTNVVSLGHTKKKPEAVHQTAWWTVDEPDMEAFDKMPEWLQNKIKGAEEWPAALSKLNHKEQAVATKEADVVVTDLGDDSDPLDVSDLEW